MTKLRALGVATAIALTGFTWSSSAPVAAATPPVLDAIDVGVAVNDIVHDPTRDVIYASVAAEDPRLPSRVVTVDPDTGRILSSFRPGPSPDAMAISDDGRFLYVGINGRGTIQRFSLPAMTPGWEFTFGEYHGRTMFPDDIEVMPGAPNTVAVSRRVDGVSPHDAGAVVIDSGVQRPDVVDEVWSVDILAFGSTPATLYGANTQSSARTFTRMAVDATGIHVVDQTHDLVPYGYPDMVAVDDLVFMSGGSIIDAAATPPRLTTALEPPRWANNVAVDEAADLVYFVSDSANLLTAWDLRSRKQVTSWVLNDGASSSTRSLRALGQGRLAYRDGGHPLGVGNLMIVHTRDIALPAPPVGDLGAYGEYTPIAPTRFLDTRDGTGRDGRVARLGPGQTIEVQIAGRNGIPATDVDAVVVNVTAVGPTAQSFLSVYPTGIKRPDIATLNMVPGTNRPNLTTVQLGVDGRLSLYNRFGSVDVVFDVAGFYASFDGPRGARFRPVAPTRIMDSRDGTGGVGTSPLGPGTTRTLQVTGRRGVPAAGVRAVVFNMTAVGPTANSFVVAYPGGAKRPTAANLNVRPGSNTGNLVVVQVPKNGTITLFNRAGSVDLVLDLVGYYDAPDGTDAGRFVSIEPFRWVDTREDSPFPGDGRLGPNFRLYSADEFPELSAFVFNLTATGTTGAGNLRAFPHPGPQPLASTVNYGPGQTVPNHAIVPTGPQVAFQNNVGRTHLVVDVFGVFL